MYADFFFLAPRIHPSTVGVTVETNAVIYLDYFIVISTSSHFFLFRVEERETGPEEKEGRIGEARGRFVYLSYKIHSRPHWEHSRAETLVFVKTRNEGRRRTTFPKWADGPPSLSSNRYVPLCSTFIRFRGVYVCTGERWARGKFYGGDKTRVDAN